MNQDSLIPWFEASLAYTKYNTFDGVDIRDRIELAEMCATANTHRNIYGMFLNIARQDNLFPHEYITPAKLNAMYPGLLSTKKVKCSCW